MVRAQPRSRAERGAAARGRERRVGRGEAQVGAAADGGRPSRRKATRRRGARAREGRCVEVPAKASQALSSPTVTPSPAPPSWEKRGSRGRGVSGEDWLGGPSIPAGSARHPAGRGLQAWTHGRGAGPVCGGRAPRSAPPSTASSAPLLLAVVASAGAVGKGK